MGFLLISARPYSLSGTINAHVAKPLRQERGHQVGQMRLVYRNAESVIVWLGPSNSEVDHVFDVMRQLDNHVLTTDRPHTTDTWETRWTFLRWRFPGHRHDYRIENALRQILRREWFTRIWVLQEVALAKSAIITCGQSKVSSRTFVMMPSLLKIECDAGEQARLEIMPGLLRRTSWWAENSTVELLTLLQKFGQSNASDQRDRIYALLGLSADAYNSDILRPNYEISLPETIQHCVAYLLMKTKDLPSQTPVEQLPRWDIDEFMEALENLPFEVFKWATDHADQALLINFLIAQKVKKNFRLMHLCMGYEGRQGSALMVAINRANSVLLDLLMPWGNENLGQKDEKGNTSLMVAAKEGDHGVLGLMLRISGVDTFPGRSRKRIQLFTATELGDLAEVEGSLNALWVDDFWSVWSFNRVLSVATRRGHQKVVCLFLRRFKTYSREAVAFKDLDKTATIGGFSKIVKMLLAYERHATLYAAHNAVVSKQLNILDIILDLDPHLINRNTPHIPNLLQTAARTGMKSINEILLDRFMMVDWPDPYRAIGTSYDQMAIALWIAASHGQLEIARLLVEKGATIEPVAQEVPNPTIPIWAAAYTGHIDVVSFLLKAGFKVKMATDDMSLLVLKNFQARTIVLRAAISVGHEEAVWRTFVEGGFNIERSYLWMTETENTENLESEWMGQQTFAKSIWIAASLGYADIVSFLIQHGADVEARDSYF